MKHVRIVQSGRFAGGGGSLTSFVSLGLGFTSALELAPLAEFEKIAADYPVFKVQTMKGTIR